MQRDDDLMDNRGVYEEYDDDEEGEFEEDGPEEVLSRRDIFRILARKLL